MAKRVKKKRRSSKAVVAEQPKKLFSGKRVVFAALFLLFVSSGVVWLILPLDPAMRAYSRAVNYLESQAPLEPDVYMLLVLSVSALQDERRLKRVSALPIQATGSDLMREGTVALAFRPEMSDVISPRSDMPLELSMVPVPVEPMTQDDLESLFWMVGLALHCRDATAEEVSRTLGLISYESHGYLLAHQLFALETLLRLGCVAPSSVLNLWETTVRRVAAETYVQRFRYDIDFERLAMLVLAGYSSVLREQALAGLLAAQNANGSWGEDELIRHHYGTQSLSREHATSLALFALSGILSSAESE